MRHHHRIAKDDTEPGILSLAAIRKLLDAALTFRKGDSFPLSFFPLCWQPLRQGNVARHLGQH